MRSFFILLITGFLALTAISCQQCQQEKEDKPVLLPGEKLSELYPEPIIESVLDTSCSLIISCPSKANDCVTKNFIVKKDTLYYLTVSYFNGDTIHPSCRSCGTIYLGDSVVVSRVTMCPTGGPWIGFAQLQTGNTYTLSVCMQRCPQFQTCECGGHAISDAAVSMRRIF